MSFQQYDVTCAYTCNKLILDLFKANIEMHIYFRTKGDGNCMCRACSKLLCGKGDLHGILRGLTSIELFKN